MEGAHMCIDDSVLLKKTFLVGHVKVHAHCTVCLQTFNGDCIKEDE